MERIKRSESRTPSEEESKILSAKMQQQLRDENPEAWEATQDFDRIMKQIDDLYEELYKVEDKLKLFKIPEKQSRESDRREIARLREYHNKKFLIDCLRT
jgi:hypothetical protein